MKTVLITTAMTILLSFTGADKLIGRWESKPSPKGNVTGVVFKPDNSFEGYVNKKPFVSGIYTFRDSIFSFTDNGCNGMRGIYKVIFFNNSDSLRFEVISDSCKERKEGMLRLVMGKVNKQPGL
jgi:hypothetical protein